MVRVLVPYPRTDNKKFDLDCYGAKHMPLVKKRLGPVKAEIDIGLRTRGKPSPYIVPSSLLIYSHSKLV